MKIYLYTQHELLNDKRQIIQEGDAGWNADIQLTGSLSGEEL